MQLYLAAAPDRLGPARQLALQPAHAAYRIGPDSRLLSLPMPTQLRGGVLMLSDREAPSPLRPEILCRDLLQECRRRSASGVLLDFTSPPSAPAVQLVRLLDRELRRMQRQLFVPELWGACTAHACVVICSAISGGQLRLRLSEAAAAFRPQSVALDCQRLAMDFLLPSPNGEGVPLSLSRLDQLQRGRTVYYSDALCARYFTYRSGLQTHFVLFDDAETLRQKIRLAGELGFSAAFFMLPEVEDLLPALFGQKKQAPPR